MIDQVLSRLATIGMSARRSAEADVRQSDTVPSLVSLVDPVVNGHLWPVHLPNDAPEITGVYHLAGQDDIDIDGFRLGRVDTYVLSLRSPVFDPLRTMSDSLVARVEVHEGMESWEITDAATDYEFDPRQYRAHFELQATCIAASGSELPVAFVHIVKSEAEPNALATCRVRQTVHEEIAIVVVADQTAIERQRRAITDALLGLESSDGVSPLEYAGGQRVMTSGRLVYWREQYRYQRLIFS
uniref:hypothetical protein n=1 Tax=Halomonas sp. TaxID=1486246 RepID=UPI00260947B0|nr:hypothetical protein [Halomonas sp.]